MCPKNLATRLLTASLFFFSFCQNAASPSAQIVASAAPATVPNFENSRETLAERFAPPASFERVEVAENSFAEWLRQLPLQPAGAQVHLFDGSLKNWQDLHAAVVRLDVGKENLQQCADAAMRLWAEYLFSKNLKGKIHFNLTNGFRVDYEKWAQGNRVQVEGNRTWWAKTRPADDSYPVFRSYLDFVFRFAGSLSLARELPEVQVSDLQAGDIFIQGGSPGHVVVVLDVVKNRKTGETRFLLGQSFMPAQEFHVLKNTVSPALGAWFELPTDGHLATPEWDFSPAVLRRFSAD